MEKEIENLAQETITNNDKISLSFKGMLTQNATSLKSAIVANCEEELESMYNQEISNLILDINKHRRAQKDIIFEMYPDTIISNKVCQNFDPQAFLNTDFDLLLNVRECVIKLNLLKNRFKELFNKDCRDINTVNKILKSLDIIE